MRAYLQAAGQASARHSDTDAARDMAVQAFLLRVSPGCDPIAELPRIIRKAKEFPDWHLLKAELERRGVDKEKVETLRVEVRRAWGEAGGMALAQLAIAEELERLYGAESKAEYLDCCPPTRLCVRSPGHRR